MEEFDAAQAEIRAMLEDDPDIFKKMDRSLHNTYQLSHGGKKGKKKAKKAPPKKKVFKARPAPARPAPAELAKRAEQHGKKNAKPAAAAA